MTKMQAHFETAVQVLEDNVDGDTAFLWTGGSEAQVIAHLLQNYVDAPSVPFVTIDTGNAFPEVYEFRQEYMSERDIDWRVERYDELLDGVINNADDPRGYHGSWDDEVELSEDLEGIAAQNASPEEWGVGESCGALKVVPMKRVIDEGYSKLVTGLRKQDPEVDEASFGHIVEEQRPITHTRINPLADWGEKQTWAYIKREFVEYPSLYDEGYRHTDSLCCTDDDTVGEYGEGGRDPEKLQARDKLQEMGYV